MRLSHLTGGPAVLFDLGDVVADQRVALVVIEAEPVCDPPGLGPL